MGPEEVVPTGPVQGLCEVSMQCPRAAVVPLLPTVGTHHEYTFHELPNEQLKQPIDVGPGPVVLEPPPRPCEECSREVQGRPSVHSVCNKAFQVV